MIRIVHEKSSKCELFQMVAGQWIRAVIWPDFLLGLFLLWRELSFIDKPWVVLTLGHSVLGFEHFIKHALGSYGRRDDRGMMEPRLDDFWLHPYRPSDRVQHRLVPLDNFHIFNIPLNVDPSLLHLSLGKVLFRTPWAINMQFSIGQFLPDVWPDTVHEKVQHSTWVFSWQVCQKYKMFSVLKRTIFLLFHFILVLFCGVAMR